MSNGAGKYELYLAVGGGADDEELDQLRIYLQNELKELDGVDRVDQISAGKTPEGAKAIDLVIIGGVALALKQAGVFEMVENVIKEWIKRGDQRKEKRKVVVKGPDGAMEEYSGYGPGEIRKMRLNPAIKADGGREA